MKVAFYAPLNPPTHPTPSGDRTMARALLSTLHYADHTTILASDLRSRDGAGDAAMQTALFEAAEAEVARCLSEPALRQAQIWLTYHNYYKAPDLIGPSVARGLGIPYAQIESTRAHKRLTGPWARFAKAAEAASDAAQTIIYMTQHDEVALRAYAPHGQHLHHLPPFLSRLDLPKLGHRNGPILTVAMMRAGDKHASYQIIADTLAALPGQDWRLRIVGDGAARKEVEALMAPFGAQVEFVGKLGPDQLWAEYADASTLLWPGVNEAYGLAYLEARAAGLTVVAQDRPGVRDVAGRHLTSVDKGPEGLATQLQIWLDYPDIRIAAGDSGRQEVAKRHLLPAAAQRLTEILKELL